MNPSIHSIIFFSFFYFNNPLPDSFINPGTAVTTVTTSQRQKEQNSLKPPPSDNPQ